MPDKDIVLAKTDAILVKHLKDIEDFYTKILLHFKFVKK